MRTVRIAPELLPEILATGCRYHRPDGGVVEITQGLDEGSALEGAYVDHRAKGELVLDFTGEGSEVITMELTYPERKEP